MQRVSFSSRLKTKVSCQWHPGVVRSQLLAYDGKRVHFFAGTASMPKGNPIYSCGEPTSSGSTCRKLTFPDTRNIRGHCNWYVAMADGMVWKEVVGGVSIEAEGW